MDLTVNNVVVFQGQVCPGQALLRYDAYLGFSGALVFIDTQGWTDPAWEGLNSRYLLAYYSETPTPPLVIPLQAVPVQNLAVELGGQNCVIGVYDQLLATSPPVGSSELPVGADSAYIDQAFLLGLAHYVVEGYWVNYSV
jgi:hypothetical protein